MVSAELAAAEDAMKKCMEEGRAAVIRAERLTDNLSKKMSSMDRMQDPLGLAEVEEHYEKACMDSFGIPHRLEKLLRVHGRYVAGLRAGSTAVPHTPVPTFAENEAAHAAAEAKLEAARAAAEAKLEHNMDSLKTLLARLQNRA